MKNVFITDSITLRGITQLELKWDVPRLKKILIGCSSEFFPLSMSALPLKNIDECVITSRIPLSFMKSNPHPIWQAHFMRNWSFLIESSLNRIELHNVIPLNINCIYMLVHGLRVSNIRDVYIHPCHPSHACLILSETVVRLTVKTVEDVGTRWKILMNAFGSRIRLVNEEHNCTL